MADWLAGILTLLALIALGVPIAIAMTTVALIGLGAMIGTAPALAMVGQVFYRTTAMLFFVLFGALLSLVLGAVLESISMLLLTVPVFFPVVSALGIDTIWFGIFVVIAIEISLITPPVGLNVYVLKAVVPDVSTSTVFRGVLPFVVMDIVRILLLIAVPALALLIPSSV